jgi:hypothetical protein
LAIASKSAFGGGPAGDFSTDLTIAMKRIAVLPSSWSRAGRLALSLLHDEPGSEESTRLRNFG